MIDGTPTCPQRGIATLSFASATGEGGLDAWSPIASGDWAHDCQQGRHLAVEAVAYMRESGDANLVPAIVRRIVQRGEVGAMEVGFFTGLAEYAAA